MCTEPVSGGSQGTGLFCRGQTTNAGDTHRVITDGSAPNATARGLVDCAAAGSFCLVAWAT